MANGMVFKYPRRKFIRAVIHRLTRAIFNVISHYEVIGAENFPETGPLIVVGNHFNFLDPVSLVSVTPWPTECRWFPNAKCTKSCELVAGVLGVLSCF